MLKDIDRHSNSTQIFQSLHPDVLYVFPNTKICMYTHKWSEKLIFISYVFNTECKENECVGFHSHWPIWEYIFIKFQKSLRKGFTQPNASHLKWKLISKLGNQSSISPSSQYNYSFTSIAGPNTACACLYIHSTMWMKWVFWTVCRLNTTHYRLLERVWNHIVMYGSVCLCAFCFLTI